MQLLSWLHSTVLGVQMLFVAFGALVLVPLLTGMSPCLALFTAGAGTLLFHAITKGKVPIFLASSFAFIAPIQQAIPQFGLGATLGGLAAAGLFYLVLSAMILFGGAGTIHRLMPSIVTGPVIMVIGLKLAPVAVGMCKSFTSGGAPEGQAMAVALISLATAIGVVMFGRGTLKLIPILCGVAVGYVICLILGRVNFEALSTAPWLSTPWSEAMRCGQFEWPRLDWAAIAFLVPVALAPSIEHVGDILAISNVTGQDYVRDPGLHRTLAGDGLATSLAALLGGPPNTTYSEVTGAVALTRAFEPKYMRIAAVTAMLVAFVSKLGGFLRTIPSPVMGGIMVLLFGMIAAIGAGTLVKAQLDMSKPRNLVIASVILVVGIGDLQVSCGRFAMGGIGLAGIVGILLNLVLPQDGAEKK
ncbi:MAG TPA: uracil-xanthine permease family protein [Kiritimatiellia bacterium]|nr:uracil-xanthine permease family protein [Kiritimatiellia bacterium]HSA18454.1 uracil-xanthine permease family protein [Kiritimatiellia bacterium]